MNLGVLRMVEFVHEKNNTKGKCLPFHHVAVSSVHLSTADYRIENGLNLLGKVYC